MRVIVRRPARHAEAFITPCLSIGPMETCTTGSPIPTRLWPESALTNASTSTSAPLVDDGKSCTTGTAGRSARFATVEPILDFDPAVLAAWIADKDPEFLNIGADSKKGHLPEPSKAAILDFLDRLESARIRVRKKANLGRLMV